MWKQKITCWNTPADMADTEFKELVGKIGLGGSVLPVWCFGQWTVWAPELCEEKASKHGEWISNCTTTYHRAWALHYSGLH